MEPPKRKVTVTVNSALLDEVERHATRQVGSTSNRSAVFEQALRLLRQWQIDKQIEEFYTTRSEADIELEAEIAAIQQEQLEEIRNDL